jgi:hypothetical protein
LALSFGVIVGVIIASLEPFRQERYDEDTMGHGNNLTQRTTITSPFPSSIPSKGKRKTSVQLGSDRLGSARIGSSRIEIWKRERI